MSCHKSLVSGCYSYIYNHRVKVVSTKQIYQRTFTLSCRALEEVLKSDLSDLDVLTIAQTMTVDQFYDLGVALGFTIQQLDVIEYRRFRDREQTIYDMLVTWRERQPPGQAAKETLLSLMESLDSPAEEMAMSGMTFAQSDGLSFFLMSSLTWRKLPPYDTLENN